MTCQLRGRKNSYHLDFSPSVGAAALVYHASLVFGADGERGAVYYLPAAVALAITLYSLVRRDGVAIAGIAGFLVAMFPVCFLPKMRSPYYVYVPQAFLILAICAFAQHRIDEALRGERARRHAALAFSMLLAAFVLIHQHSDYFRNRINFTIAVRRICMKSAVDVRKHLSGIPSGAQFFFLHGPERPWLFAVGNCDYLKLVSREPNLVCTWEAPNDRIEERFENSPAPKYLLQYHDDGSFDVVGASTSP